MIRNLKQHRKRCEDSFCVGRALTMGMSDKEISAHLNMKKRTVKQHIDHLCREFGVPRSELKRIPLAVKLYQYPIFRGE